MNKSKIAIVFLATLALIVYEVFLSETSKSRFFQAEILQYVESNHSDFEQLAEGLIQINKSILRDSMLFYEQTPNKISIETRKPSGYSYSVSSTKIGLPNGEIDDYITNKLFNMDSINHAGINTIKALSSKLEFYEVTLDTLDVVTFELLRGSSPIEQNIYHLSYNPKLSDNNFYTKISNNLYFIAVFPSQGGLEI